MIKFLQVMCYLDGANWTGRSESEASLARCLDRSSCVVRSRSVGGGKQQNLCIYFKVRLWLVMLARREPIALQMITVNPQHNFWESALSSKHSRLIRQISVISVCSDATFCSLACGLWASGDNQILSHRDDSAVTKQWLYYLGRSHFDLRND